MGSYKGFRRLDPVSMETMRQQAIEAQEKYNAERPTSTETKTIDEIAEALRLSDGLLTIAAKHLGMYYMAVRGYIERYPYLRQVCFEIEEANKDEVEGALQRQIKRGNMRGIMFYLRTKAKDRGYTETFQVEATVQVEHKRKALQVVMDDPVLRELNQKMCERLEYLEDAGKIPAGLIDLTPEG